MNVQRLIVASVMTQGVFQRFAQLSKGDKDKVVEKVKEKVNGKGKKKDDVVEEEVVDEKKEEIVDDGAAEDGNTDEKSEGGGSLDDLVGDLAEEIEVIKSDGQIAPSEVVGLIDNVVKMVHVLLQAKPGKEKEAASREAAIVERMLTAARAGATKREIGIEAEVKPRGPYVGLLCEALREAERECLALKEKADEMLDLAGYPVRWGLPVPVMARRRSFVVLKGTAEMDISPDMAKEIARLRA